MKKTQIIILAILSILFINCEIKEEITFNKDGSGELFYTYDMSKMLKEIPDSSKAADDMDTIFDFDKMLNDPKFKDSIAALSPEKRKTLESLRMMKMKMIVNSEEKKAEMGFGFGFKDINKLEDVLKKIQTAQQAVKTKKDGNPIKESPLYDGLSGNNQNVSYSFDGKHFKKSVSLKHKITEKDNKDMDNMVKSQDEISKLFDALKYTIILNFPKKIKKVNNKNAVFSNNHKTVSISYSIDEYLKNPEKLNLEIELNKH